MKTLNFEVVQETNGTIAIKVQPRKKGKWFTVCECFCVPAIGDARQVADKIKFLLNEKEARLKAVRNKEHVFSPHTDKCIYCNIDQEDHLMDPSMCGEVQ